MKSSNGNKTSSFIRSSLNVSGTVDWILTNTTGLKSHHRPKRIGKTALILLQQYKMSVKDRNVQTSFIKLVLQTAVRALQLLNNLCSSPAEHVAFQSFGTGNARAPCARRACFLRTVYYALIEERP